MGKTGRVGYLNDLLSGNIVGHGSWVIWSRVM